MVIGTISHFSVGGLILDFTVANYHGIAVFQPVINGKFTLLFISPIMVKQLLHVLAIFTSDFSLCW